LKHIDVRQHWLRGVNDNAQSPAKIEFVWQSTEEMAADGLTKKLDRARFETFVAQLSMTQVTSAAEALEAPEMKMPFSDALKRGEPAELNTKIWTD
jgi:hypothetical protein